MKQVQFPIRHIEKNFVFNNHEQVWAYYEILPVDYTYRSPEQKKRLRNEWLNLLRKMEREMHILSIPLYLDVREHQEKLKQTIADSPLKKNAEFYIDQMTQVLEKKQKRPIKQRVFLGIKLKREKAQTRKKLSKKIRFQFNDFKRFLYTTAGIEPYDILEEELFAYQVQEQAIFQRIRECIACERASVYDLQYLIKHSAYRGIREPFVSETWKPRADEFEMEGHTVIRPNQQDIQVLVNGEYHVNPQFMSVSQLDEGEVKTGWMQFLYLSYMPDDLIFPGEEWAYWLQSLPFAVDVSIRIQVIPHEQAAELLGRQKRRLMYHVEHTRTDGQQQDLDLEQAYAEATQEEMNLVRSKEPILDMTACFCVYANTKEKLVERSNQLISLYRNRNKDMQIVISPGDQFLSFHEFLPGSIRHVPDFSHKLKPAMVAEAMFNASQHLGDQQGMFIGFTGPSEISARSLDRPVFVHQAIAAQGGEQLDTKSLSTLICGLTGYGKSFASALLVYQSMHHLGSRVLLLDTKGERGNWGNELPGCQNHVSLIRLGSDPKYRGMMDPFLIFSREEAPLYATDFLKQLIQVERGHEWHHTISEAIQETRESDNPSMMQVLERIKAKDARLYRALSLYETFPFAQLVFGDGNKPGHALHLEKPLNIIQIDELRLPRREKNPKHYDELEILSKALMLPITGFVNQLIKRDRHIFKQVWWEEAWIPLASDLGQRAVDEGIRMGRYWNAGTLLVTQNPSDVPDALVNNIGMRFIFKTVDEKEITKAIEILQIENTESNRNAIRHLKEGECFMRDIYGRVGRVYIDVLFKNLADAFDTTPPDQQREKVIS